MNEKDWLDTAAKRIRFGPDRRAVRREANEDGVTSYGNTMHAMGYSSYAVAFYDENRTMIEEIFG